MAPEELYQMLLNAGCSEDFSEEAIKRSDLYSGDLQKFIDLTEELIAGESQAPNGSSMDRGSKVTERDYTGDNLNSGGFDYENKGRRW